MSDERIGATRVDFCSFAFGLLWIFLLAVKVRACLSLYFYLAFMKERNKGGYI